MAEFKPRSFGNRDGRNGGRDRRQGGDRGGRGFGGGNRNGGRNFGGNRGGFGNRGRPEMHDVVCAECGKNTTVPFKPNGDKPVLCRDCFGGKEDRGNRRSNSGSSGVSKEDFEKLSKKVDKILELLDKKE